MEKVNILSEIMESMYEFERIMQSYQNTPRQYGTEDLLYMTEAHTIEEIGNNPGQTLKQLAEKTYRTESAMSLVIKNLNKKNLIIRNRSLKDNRKYEIFLTEKGKKVYETHDAMDKDNYKYFLFEIQEKINYSSKDLKNISEFLSVFNMVINNYLLK